MHVTRRQLLSSVVSVPLLANNSYPIKNDGEITLVRKPLSFSQVILEYLQIEGEYFNQLQTKLMGMYPHLDFSQSKFAIFKQNGVVLNEYIVGDFDKHHGRVSESCYRYTYIIGMYRTITDTKTRINIPLKTIGVYEDRGVNIYKLSPSNAMKAIMGILTLEEAYVTTI